MRVLIATLMVMLLGLAGKGEETKSPHNIKAPSGKEYVERVLSAKNSEDFHKFLIKVDPEKGDFSWALAPILDDIRKGAGSDAHWKALVRLNSWGDGAWHLELKGACYDAVVANPEIFLKQYVQGRDEALWIITNAIAWPVDMIEMSEGDNSELKETKEFDKGVEKIQQAMFSVTPPHFEENVRELVMFDVVNHLIDLRYPARENYLHSLHQKKEQGSTPGGE
jgi:hypothetical protein